MQSEASEGLSVLHSKGLQVSDLLDRKDLYKSLTKD